MRSFLIICAAQVLFLQSASAFTLTYASDSYSVSERIWIKAYKESLKENVGVEGATYIMPLKGNGLRDRLHKNGARDTIVFIPHDTSIEKPVDIIFYFHGLGGFKKRDFKERVLAHTEGVNTKENYIIVIPEMPWSMHTSTPRKRQGRVFMHQGEFSTFVKGVQDILNSHFESPCSATCGRPHPPATIGTVILLGHSAGGSALMSISRSGGLNWLYSGAGAKSVKVIFSDASYGYWLDRTWKYFSPYISSTEFIILTRKWDKPYKNAQRFLKRFKKAPTSIKHIVFNRSVSHAQIGDRSFRWIYESLVDSGCGEGENK